MTENFQNIDPYVRREEIASLTGVPVAVSNKATGGSIGSAATTVDIASAINVSQTTAAQTLTVPNPTNTGEEVRVFLNNVGSTSFTALSTVIAPGAGIQLVWTGSAYNVIGTSSGASNVTVAGGKTFTVSNTMTLAGTDGVTLTTPSTSQTLVGLTATQTLTNKTLTSPVLTGPTLGVATATSLNGLTVTTSTGTLTVTNGKTLAASNTLTLAGTDSTVMTFPSTSATIARTDAANTFTGVQTMTSPVISGHATIEGVTPTGATGTGNLVLSAAPTLSGNVTFSGHTIVEGVTSTGATGTGKVVYDGTPTLVTPVIGAATGTSLRTTSGIGYVGIQEALTQGTGKSTTVTSVTNSVSTVITSHNASLVGGTAVSFTFANTSIAATDVVHVSVKSGASTGLYVANVTATGSGSCIITIQNIASTASEVVIMNVVIFKAS